MKKLLLTFALVGVVSAGAASKAYGDPSFAGVMIVNKTDRTVEYDVYWGSDHWHEYAKPGWSYRYGHSYNPNGMQKPSVNFHISGGNPNTLDLQGLSFGSYNQPWPYFIQNSNRIAPGGWDISDVFGREDLPQGVSMSAK